MPQVDLMLARKRAELFSAQGIGVADAAHLAFAEQARADFVTVDDRFLKKTKRFMLPIWTGSPLAYCEKENLR
jgi:predicted nucleic acid-binding protein